MRVRGSLISFFAESFDLNTFSEDDQMECKGYHFIQHLFEGAGLSSKVICIQEQVQLLTICSHSSSHPSNPPGHDDHPDVMSDRSPDILFGDIQTRPGQRGQL